MILQFDSQIIPTIDIGFILLTIHIHKMLGRTNQFRVFFASATDVNIFCQAIANNKIDGTWVVEPYIHDEYDNSVVIESRLTATSLEHCLTATANRLGLQFADRPATTHGYRTGNATFPLHQINV